MFIPDHVVVDGKNVETVMCVRHLCKLKIGYGARLADTRFMVPVFHVAALLHITINIVRATLWEIYNHVSTTGFICKFNIQNHMLGVLIKTD